jgi:hypothetical protein
LNPQSVTVYAIGGKRGKGMKKKGFWWFLFGRIEGQEDAILLVKECAKAFYLVAGLYFIGSVLFRRNMLGLADVFLLVILTLLLTKFNSRVVAIILFLLAGVSMYNTAIILFGEGEGGRNIVLAVIFVWCGVRAIQGTFKYQSFQKRLPVSPPPVTPP